MNTTADIVVTGTHRLSGTILASGAKNSVLKLMAATILVADSARITNVPAISDVYTMMEVLSALGARVDLVVQDSQPAPAFSSPAATLNIDTSNLTNFKAPAELVNKMRASIAVLGPLLGRYHQAQVAVPGGCQIGERKLDIHFAALEALGMQFETDDTYIYARAPGGLRGATVPLRFPSVGATENLMMAAVLAHGTTVIDNAAREPEIGDLADYLNAMGARIHGAGSSQIHIEGVTELHPTDYQTIGDRIEAATFLVAAALTGGRVTVTGIRPSSLSTALMKLEDMAIHVEKTEQSITVWRDASQPIRATDIQTLPFPGFPTDLQAIFMVLACLASGESHLTENIYEDRFHHARWLSEMGAHITLTGRRATVHGVDRLHGATVTASDLRGGAALVLAGLAAVGQTRVTETGYIDRGYQHFVQKLRSLGAEIDRA